MSSTITFVEKTIAVAVKRGVEPVGWNLAQG